MRKGGLLDMSDWSNIDAVGQSTRKTRRRRRITGRDNAMRKLAFVSGMLLAGLAGVGAAHALSLTSPDIKPNAKIADEQVFNGWDCTGKNVSPALNWSGAPNGTKSFAINLY